MIYIYIYIYIYILCVYNVILYIMNTVYTSSSSSCHVYNVILYIMAQAVLAQAGA